MQNARRSLKNEMEKQVLEINQRKPTRNPNENYADLLSELRQMKEGLLSTETVETLIKDLEKMSFDAVEKCEAWLKSLGPVIFSIPIRFKSYSDVWIPFIWGCTNIIMGMLNYRKKCALKCLRKDAIKIFDDLRQLNNFENLDDISCTKTNLVNRDERLHTENFKINLERVVENLSGNVKKEQEQKLISNTCFSISFFRLLRAL